MFLHERSPERVATQISAQVKSFVFNKAKFQTTFKPSSYRNEGKRHSSLFFSLYYRNRHSFLDIACKRSVSAHSIGSAIC